MVAALFVLADGPYANRPGVDPWPAERDARQYDGPHRVVAQPATNQTPPVRRSAAGR